MVNEIIFNGLLAMNLNLQKNDTTLRVLEKF